MSHLCLWPGEIIFYPIGTTSAVCLTEDLPPEEDATVLLLGCGDPRSILYTLYASGADLASLSRNLDFTCCDVEGAVLARNVLLLSLLADDGALERIDQIWDIFYHFYLDDSTSLLLSTQSQKLANLSADLLTWENSEYGPFLRMCTNCTLSNLRGYWTSYAETGSFTQAQQDLFRKDFSLGVRSAIAGATCLGYGYNCRAGGSAGPLSGYIQLIVTDHFHRYWRTGTTSSKAQLLTRVNPTFVYSSQGDKFLVYGSTDPLVSFHLAEAYTQLHDSSDPSKSVTADDIVATCKAQFRQWCTAFVKVLRTDVTCPRVVVRFFAGDALAFCRALRYCRVAQTTISLVYTAPWNASRIELNHIDYGANTTSPAPMEFNIIDTSNIMDHVGFLNVLIAASPLLKQSLSSTLYIEALLPSGKDPYTGVLQHACADLPTLALLLGLIPSTFVCQFTIQPNIFDIMAARLSESSHLELSQFHERLAWKVAAGRDTIAKRGIDTNPATTFAPQQLSEILFNIYLKMFPFENQNRIISNAPSELKSENTVHYNRRTFAELVGVVKERIYSRQDWQQVMETFHDLVKEDYTLCTRLNHYQDLFCQLHILGIYSIPILPQIEFLASKRANKSAIFRGWKTIPTTVCIVMQVPSQIITPITALLNKTGTPILQCEVRDSMFLNEFSCIHTTYGKLSLSGTQENQRAVIAEDPAGRATNPLIVSFWVPSNTLMLESSARVGLYLRSTPAADTLVSILGQELMICNADIGDERLVQVLTERPNLGGEVEETAAILEEAQEQRTQPTHSVVVAMNTTCEKIETLATRIYITNASTKLSLASSSLVTMEQVTPFVVQIHIGEYRHVILFPLAIDAAESKVRMARKSKYVEIVAPLPLAYVKGRPDIPIGKFALTMQGQTAILWNVHRVNLDRLPILKDEDPGKVGWLTFYIGLMYSDRERKMREEALTTSKAPPDVMLDLKGSLFSMFTGYIGFPNPEMRSRAFGLFNSSTANVYMIIFVTGIRLDLNSHTVVADACVLPLPIVPIDSISTRGAIGVKVSYIKTGFEEMRAWKQLLPVLTERCRTWRHKESCEYLTKGMVPLSLECAESPICTCGRGMGTAELQKVKEWKHLAPFVTRAALSPIFSVSYLESVGGILMEEISRKKAAQKHSTSPDVGGSTGRELVCAVCGNKGQPRLLRCSKCRKVSYCSAECQLREWKKHKLQCTV